MTTTETVPLSHGFTARYILDAAARAELLAIVRAGGTYMDPDRRRGRVNARTREEIAATARGRR